MSAWLFHNDSFTFIRIWKSLWAHVHVPFLITFSQNGPGVSRLWWLILVVNLAESAKRWGSGHTREDFLDQVYGSMKTHLNVTVPSRLGMWLLYMPRVFTHSKGKLCFCLLAWAPCSSTCWWAQPCCCWHHSCGCDTLSFTLEPSFFGLPMWTEHGWISKNLSGLQHQGGTAEVPSQQLPVLSLSGMKRHSFNTQTVYHISQHNKSSYVCE